MINAILEGFFLGLVLAVLIGPVFFQMIDLSISKNKKTALIFAFGVWLSDITVLSLCVVLINQIEEWHLLESKILEYLAFVVFIIFGITKLLSKPSVSNTLQIKANKKILFSQGYLINTVNPSVWAFWLSIFSFMLSENSTSFSLDVAGFTVKPPFDKSMLSKTIDC